MALPDAKSWDELLEETSQEPALKELKSAIARGYFTPPEKKALGPQFDPVFTELAVVGGLVVGGSRIVVSKVLRDKVVRIAHERHHGVTLRGQRIISGPGSGFLVWPDGRNLYSALPPMPGSNTSV